MYESSIAAVAASLSISLDIPVRTTDELTDEELDAFREILLSSDDDIAEIAVGGQRFVGARFGLPAADFLLAGPYRRENDAVNAARLLSDEELGRVRASLEVAIQGLRDVMDAPRRLLDSSRQMEILSSAIIAISSELQLNTVLRTITDLARMFAGAKYAALGVPDAEGRMKTFITAGVSEAAEARIGHRPEGLGLLGLLLRERSPVRLDDLTQHPESIGFPDGHPDMRSFLGVPIVAHSGEIIGSLYLAEEQSAVGFSVEDEMVIELLARHAAVAIENARLYFQLEFSERRLGEILEQLPAAVMLVEPHPERIVVMNHEARRLLGIDSPLPIAIEALGQECEFFDSQEQPLKIEETPFLRTLRDGLTIEGEELTVSSSSDVKHTLLVNSKPIYFDGILDVHSYICVFQDISEIRDADRLKDDFLSLVSHELRTPLTTIHGGAQLLLQNSKVLDPDVRDELLADIHQESARLAALIQNMVQLTHVRAGRVALEPEPVLLRILVERCVKQFEELDPEREYRVDIGPQIVAMADGDRLDEILRNLLSNALKYTPPGTQIDISGRNIGAWVELAVRDYGLGIPHVEVAHIFERFERGSKASSQSSGMGLGLYLVRLLVEAQGGEVSIELPRDGGTRFVVLLPRAAVDA